MLEDVDITIINLYALTSTQSKKLYNQPQKHYLWNFRNNQGANLQVYRLKCIQNKPKQIFNFYEGGWKIPEGEKNRHNQQVTRFVYFFHNNRNSELNPHKQWDIEHLKSFFKKAYFSVSLHQTQCRKLRTAWKETSLFISLIQNKKRDLESFLIDRCITKGVCCPRVYCAMSILHFFHL